MPPRDLPIRIADIRTAIEKIQKHTRGFSKETFKADEKTVQAVLYNFAVIGEAAARIPTPVRKKYPQTPWKQMVGMRNILIHEYFGVSIDILWETIRVDLPALLPHLEDIANSAADSTTIDTKKKRTSHPKRK